MRTILILIICLALSATCTTLSAQEKLPAPYSEVKGKIIISEFHSIDQTISSEGIFINALLWMIEAQEPENDEDDESAAIEVDYDKKQFMLELVQTPRNGESRYRYVFSAKVADNIITFLASNITCEAETSVIKIVKRQAFEKLQPEKKPKHKEHLTEFANLHDALIDKVLEAITANPAPTITHWAEIKAKDVVKGMSKPECLLAFGKPASVQKQGNKEEWMYDSYTYVFFEDGIVTSLIK